MFPMLCKRGGTGARFYEKRAGTLPILMGWIIASAPQAFPFSHRSDCGYTEDRDVNAARNILFKAIGHNPEPRYGQLELILFWAWNVPSWMEVVCHAR
ncbi:transposase [Desmospora sp. 8437]|nr:transposase [Desmospora sp. 8437]